MLALARDGQKLGGLASETLRRLRPDTSEQECHSDPLGKGSGGHEHMEWTKETPLQGTWKHGSELGRLTGGVARNRGRDTRGAGQMGWAMA